MYLKTIDLETAKLLKEKGFSEITSGYHVHDNVYPAPNQELVKKWLREKHQLCITITFGIRSWDGFGYYCGDVHRREDGLVAKINWEGDRCEFKGPIPIKNLTYEEALEIGLQEALKLIK